MSTGATARARTHSSSTSRRPLCRAARSSSVRRPERVSAAAYFLEPSQSLFRAGERRKEARSLDVSLRAPPLVLPHLHTRVCPRETHTKQRRLSKLMLSLKRSMRGSVAPFVCVCVEGGGGGGGGEGRGQCHFPFDQRPTPRDDTERGSSSTTPPIHPPSTHRKATSPQLLRFTLRAHRPRGESRRSLPGVREGALGQHCLSSVALSNLKMAAAAAAAVAAEAAAVARTKRSRATTSNLL